MDGEITKLCSEYVAFLRCLYLIHQNNHWCAIGDNFYGNHLLFERIYKSAQENADQAAEKFVGLIGVDVLDFSHQAEILNKLMQKYSKANSLDAEKDFIEFNGKFYELIKKSKIYSIGLDDTIMSIASNREEAIYLLQQTFGGINKKISERINLLKRLIKR